VAINALFAGVPVADYGVAVAWYQRLLGGPPDMRPHATEAVWRIVGDGWVYVVEDRERAGRGLLTLIVEDLDARVAELAQRGLAAGPVEPIGAVGRRAVIADPDGNTITFAQVESAGEG
jgi:predicted enzyme related to lactoylglutathione lyase